MFKSISIWHYKNSKQPGSKIKIRKYLKKVKQDYFSLKNKIIKIKTRNSHRFHLVTFSIHYFLERIQFSIEANLPISQIMSSSVQSIALTTDTISTIISFISPQILHTYAHQTKYQSFLPSSGYCSKIFLLHSVVPFLHH